MGEWTVASQRKRGPTALHHRLWSGLPLLWIEFSDQRSSSRFWHMLIGGRFGSTTAGSPHFGQPAPMRSIAALQAVIVYPTARGQRTKPLSR
jgi:hypothetical protein